LSFGDYPLKVKYFIDFKKIKTIKGWRKYYSYQQSALFFKFLTKKYGDKKISELIKRIKEKSEEESFKEVNLERN